MSFYTGLRVLNLRAIRNKTNDVGISDMPNYAIQRLYKPSNEHRKVIVKSSQSSLPGIMVLDEELGRHLVVTALAVQQRDVVGPVHNASIILV